jgi:hypothetical protein
LNTTHDVRPQFKRRFLDQDRIERHGVKIVVQEGSAPTVTRITGHPDPRSALAPMAGTTDVAPGRIGQKDVSALASTLSPALESSTGSRERNQVGIIIDCNKEVGILRVMFVSG